MDQKFQTSFIPRKSAVDVVLPRRRPIGLFTLLSISIFILAIIIIVGLFAYKTLLARQSVALKIELDSYNEKIHAPIVAELHAINTRLNVGQERLNKHIAASEVLNILSAMTLHDVRWNNFKFESNDAGALTLTMKGQARSFAAVALQADKFSTDTTHFRNPLVSDLNLDQDGNPIFSFKAELLPAAITFGKTVAEATSTEEIQ